MWPTRVGGKANGDAPRFEEGSLLCLVGREKLCGLLANDGGLTGLTGLCGPLVLDREIVSSLDADSTLRIWGRYGRVEEEAAAAAAVEAEEDMEVETLPGRGEKLPGALCWGRNGCIVLTLFRFRNIQAPLLLHLHLVFCQSYTCVYKRIDTGYAFFWLQHS